MNSEINSSKITDVNPSSWRARILQGTITGRLKIWLDYRIPIHLFNVFFVLHNCLMLTDRMGSNSFCNQYHGRIWKVYKDLSKYRIHGCVGPSHAFVE